MVEYEGTAHTVLTYSLSLSFLELSRLLYL